MLQRTGSRAAPIVLMVRNYLVPVAGVLVLLEPARRMGGLGHLAQGDLDDLRAAGDRGDDQRGQPPGVPPRREGVVARPVPDDLQRPHPVRVHHRGHRAGVLVGVGCRCRGCLRRSGHHLHRRGPRAAERRRIDRLGACSSSSRRPSRSGDWIQTGSIRGQIIEVNWRAIHLDTGNGIVVMPTAELAEGSFTNLSRAVDPYSATKEVEFATDDPPLRVREMLVRGRARNPARLAGSRADASRRPVERTTGSRSRCSRRATRGRCSTRSRRVSGTPRAAPICISTAT